MLAEGYLVLTPAYGRDYRSKAEVMADWNANKDFIISHTGQTISKSCAPKMATMEIRYWRLRKLTLIHT